MKLSSKNRIVGVAAALIAAVAVGAFLWSRPQSGRPTQPVETGAALSPAGDPSAELVRVALAARQNPRNAELAVEAGGLAGDQGQYEEALRWFGRAERTNPRLIPAITGQGQMWMKLGRPGLAVAAYEKALKLAPDEPKLILELALAHTFLREFAEALAYVERAEKVAGENAETCRARAHIYAGNMETTRSLEYAERACRLSPEDPENWVTWGNLLLGNRKYADALEPLRRAISLDSAHVAANVSYARALVEGRKTAEADREAFDSLARVRTLQPTHSEALLLQGQILIRAGQTQLGTSLLRRAWEQSPRDSAVLLALGQALVRSGKGEEGVRLIREGQKIGPRGVSFLDVEDLVRKSSDPAVVERLAELYRKQEMYDSAIRTLERALRRSPGEARLQRKLEEIRAELKRWSGDGREDKE